jgi:hypothetical protein
LCRNDLIADAGPCDAAIGLGSQVVGSLGGIESRPAEPLRTET